ncbi:MAG: prevent-host-death protein [Fibrobacter sp.]|nr:prevent-host-death protein [Fibrobacter sp.]
MKTVKIKDIETSFDKLLIEVNKGTNIGILDGKRKKPVAMIVPYSKEKDSKRRIGILDGKISIKFDDKFKFSTNDFLNLK